MVNFKDGELVKGAYVIINDEQYYVRDIMDITYDTKGLEYIDGNKYNNSIWNFYFSNFPPIMK